MTLPTTANVTDPRRLGYDALLGDLYLRLAVASDRALTVQSADAEGSGRVQTQANPEEFIEDYGRVFARDDFSGGEGLFAAHTREQRQGQATRYWDSEGIDVHVRRGEPPFLTLLHDTARIHEMAGGTGRAASNGLTSLVVAGPAGAVIVALNAHTASPTFASEATGAAAALDVAVLGNYAYAACGAQGVYRRTSANVWAQWSASHADRVWAAKDRIVAFGAGVLREVPPSGGAGTILYTLPNGATVTGVVDAGAGIAASATNGYIYAFAPAEDGTLTVRAQSLVREEAVVGLTSTQGLIAYVTCSQGSARLWRAALDGQGAIADAQLIREWPTAAAATAITSTRDDVFVVGRAAGVTQTWRYSLSAGGLFRHLSFAAPASTANGIVPLGERLFISTDAAGIWRDDPDAYVPEGWLIGPSGDLFTASTKTWVDARLRAIVDDTESVALLYSASPDDLLRASAPGWVRAIERTATSTAEQRRLVGVRSRSIAGQVRLRAPADRASTPRVLAFGFRAYTSSEDQIVTLPVNVSDVIERRGRRALHVPGHGEKIMRALMAARAGTTRLDVYRPDVSLRGVVESVGAPVPAVTRSGSPTAYALVRFRGARVSSSPGLTAAGLGTRTLGRVALGGLL